jgi:AraC-like DNA-binding protein
MNIAVDSHDKTPRYFCRRRCGLPRFLITEIGAGRPAEFDMGGHLCCGAAMVQDRRDMTRVETSYREFRPPPQLADRLVCFWSSRADGPTAIHKQHVLPDGCVDIVWVGDRAPTVAGPATRHVHVPLPVGVDIVGLRFQPGSAQALLGLPADALLDVSVPLADLWGRSADCFARPIREAESVRAKLDLLARGSLQRFAGMRPSDSAVAASVAWLSRRRSARVEDLGSVSDLSPRQLQRRFRAAVGYGPKTFQRILRLQRLLDLSASGAGQTRNLAAWASSTGYADQAHMSREVRELTGMAPSSLLVGSASTLAMSDLFKTGAGAGS